MKRDVLNRYLQWIISHALKRWKLSPTYTNNPLINTKVKNKLYFLYKEKQERCQVLTTCDRQVRWYIKILFLPFHTSATFWTHHTLRNIKHKIIVILYGKDVLVVIQLQYIQKSIIIKTTQYIFLNIFQVWWNFWNGSTRRKQFTIHLLTFDCKR